MVVCRKTYIGIIGSVTAASLFLDLFQIRRSVGLAEGIIKDTQMRTQPYIHLHGTVLVDRIWVCVMDLCFLLQHFQLLCKILIRPLTEYLHIKRKFLLQHLVLVIRKHHGKRTAKKRDGKQCGQRPHRKLHGLYLGGKLPQEKQVFPFVNGTAFFSHIADDPGGQSHIKQVDRENQRHQEQQNIPRTPRFSEKQLVSQEKQQQDGCRKQPFFQRFMGFPDLFILLPRVHQLPDVHFPEFPGAAEQCQDIAAPIAGCRHQKAPEIQNDLQAIRFLEHAIEDGQ